MMCTDLYSVALSPFPFIVFITAHNEILNDSDKILTLILDFKLNTHI